MSALEPEHKLVICPSWRALNRAVADVRVEGCIVDPHSPDEPVSLAALRRLRHRRPTVALIVYGDFRGRELELFHLGRLGANAIVMAGGEDSEASWLKTIASALAESLAVRVAAQLEGRVPEPELRVVRWAVEHAHERPRTGELAAAFGTRPGALNARLRAARLPTAGRLLVWGRLIRGAAWLEDPDHTIDAVAYRLGYSSGAGFRRALQRYTGLRPSHVRAVGGVNAALEAFSARALEPEDGRRKRRGSSRAIAGRAQRR